MFMEKENFKHAFGALAESNSEFWVYMAESWCYKLFVSKQEPEIKLCYLYVLQELIYSMAQRLC